MRTLLALHRRHSFAVSRRSQIRFSLYGVAELFGQSVQRIVGAQISLGVSRHELPEGVVAERNEDRRQVSYEFVEGGRLRMDRLDEQRAHAVEYGMGEFMVDDVGR